MHQVAWKDGTICEAALGRQASRVFARRWKSLPASISSAPSARMAAFFSTELPCGTTIVAGTPIWAAASEPGRDCRGWR